MGIAELDGNKMAAAWLHRNIRWLISKETYKQADRRSQPYFMTISYVYWTVHHLDSLVKRDQLDATCFIITLFSAQHVSDVNTSILRSLRLIR